MAQENPQAALELLILKTLAATGPNHGFGIALHIDESSSGLLRVENGRRARVYRLTRSGRKRLKEIEESWNTLAEGVKRVLRWA